MAIRKILELASNTGSLKEWIEKRLGSERDVPPLDPDGYIRVSSFAKMCPREEVICARDGITRSDEVEPSLQLIFDHGTALHWALQNLVLPQLDVLLGEWRCNTCSWSTGKVDFSRDISETAVSRPTKCPNCDGEPGREPGTRAYAFTYIEQHLHNDDFRIKGHPDGFLNVPGLPGLGILEAKSIGQAWKVKTAPQVDHVIQAHCYMWLANLKWAKIFYWEKGGRGLNALIEHHIDRDEDTIVGIKLALNSIWDGIRTGDLPERICSSYDCNRAGDCAVSRRCFELSDKI